MPLPAAPRRQGAALRCRRQRLCNRVARLASFRYRHDALQVERLADQLAAVNEDAFRRVGNAAASRALYGGRPNTDDWAVSAAAPRVMSPTLSGDDGSGGEEEEEEPAGADGAAAASAADVDADEVDVAPAGRLPFMEACLQVGPWAD